MSHTHQTFRWISLSMCMPGPLARPKFLLWKKFSLGLWLAWVNSKGSGETVHLCSLARTFTVGILCNRFVPMMWLLKNTEKQTFMFRDLTHIFQLRWDPMLRAWLLEAKEKFYLFIWSPEFKVNFTGSYNWVSIGQKCHYVIHSSR